MDAYDEFISKLQGIVALPSSRFVSYAGYLTDEQLQNVADALLKCKNSLYGIRLQTCNIDDAHVRVLVKSLEVNNTLEILELPDNRIGRAGAVALRDVLNSQNCALKAVDVSGTAKSLHQSQQLPSGCKAVTYLALHAYVCLAAQPPGFRMQPGSSPACHAGACYISDLYAQASTVVS